ncbi:MAG TPA: tRNA (adenosine(37)-N6)-threonylcarbamoyltransferase complex ATPase subunit type 1 TsaE [Candidatus Dormibacteraeota bacterium]|nr:tRNA (adenosine(37)-N6)-threonylcarbamoyltransferase complex ATPase subunit type 1 TsaE [Candidatus Dormibacteraeota bacterium]
MSLEIITNAAEETMQQGRELAKLLTPPVMVLLSGDLGSGKTTLTKGIVAGLGAAKEDDVTSPTFTLVHVYKNHCKVFHADLYRVEDFHDLETLGLEDVFVEPAVLIIEWSERFALHSNWPAIRVHLEHIENDRRRIRISDLESPQVSSSSWCL